MADLSIGTTIGGFAAYHAGNYFPDKTTVGLGSVNNWSASDSHTTASSTTYATSAAVKAAYDAAMAAVAALGAPAWGSITGKPATFAPSAHTHTAADITDLNNQASAATANTLALRDSAADISVRLLRANYADQATMSGAIAFRVNNSSDNYTRYCSSPTAIMNWLGAFANTGGTLNGNINAPAGSMVSYGTTGFRLHGNTYGFFTSLDDVHLCQNAYWDATAWKKVDNAKASKYLVLNSATPAGSARIYYSAAGATNPLAAYADIFTTAYPPSAAQVGAMADGGSYGTVYTNNWFRSIGNSGWYSETYGGGVYMVDTTWLRSYNNKSFYTAGEGAFGSNVTAYYSDERLKEVVEELDPEFCLDAVNRWRKVRYHANDLGAKYGYDPKKMEVGLLAGEVNKDFPELTPLAPFDYETLEDGSIISKSGENYKTMTYERVVAVQAAAITALTRRLEKLEAKQDV